MPQKISRNFLTLCCLIATVLALAYAFRSRPLQVDIGEVKRGRMVLTINEEGRTRVHDTYAVSTPVAGRLLRVAVLPGDTVTGGESVVAQMLPAHPAALDVRSREQTHAEVTAAEAALRLARAELNKAVADQDLAKSELNRTRRLHQKAMLSDSALDHAVREAQAAQAQFRTAQAGIAMRKAELANAQARLISFGSEGRADVGLAASQEPIPIYSPVTGRVLRVLQESATTLPVGTPILEIGNIENDLEVVVELLSSDAVKVSPSNPVIFEDWGGSSPLHGIVERVEPYGFTKFSALGVEEQRVNTIIRFTDPKPMMQNLGHGFRVEARIIIWEDDNALIAPSSSLFRAGENWAVFVVRDGKANLRHITLGRNNGIEAQILDGMEAGEKVVLYPSSQLNDGAKVAQRTLE